MACLRESSIEGRSGTLRCDEEGCQFRLHPHPDDCDALTRSPQANHFLQLQLRTGSPENCSGVCPVWGHDVVDPRDPRVERVIQILELDTTKLAAHREERDRRLFAELERHYLSELERGLDKELSRFNPTGILNDNGIAIAEFGEALNNPPIRIEQQEARAAVYIGTIENNFGPTLDESRRRREAGEPSNVKVTAWEILPDGERVEIVHARIERGCPACGKPWTEEELDSNLPASGSACNRCFGHEPEYRSWYKDDDGLTHLYRGDGVWDIEPYPGCYTVDMRRRVERPE